MRRTNVLIVSTNDLKLTRYVLEFRTPYELNSAKNLKQNLVSFVMEQTKITNDNTILW